jgi:hypothetical protein
MGNGKFRRAVKIVIQRVGRVVPVTWYLDLPLRHWPRVLGVVHEIAVPHAVLPHKGDPISGQANINTILELVDHVKHVSGDVAECGVFRGRTLLALALYLRQNRSIKRVVGFDSFAGFDDSIKMDIGMGGADTDENRKVGGFSNTSLELVLSRARLLALTNIELAEGFFCTTLPKYCDRRFSFVHLDCDTYSSYKECLTFFYPRIPPGGVVLFDEYNDPPWPGCNQAIDEFLCDKPEKPIRVVRDNFEKYYIVKQ